MSNLNERQVQYLGMDLAGGRVGQRSQAGRSFSYLEAWDVRRTLIRVFGYIGFSADVIGCEQVFEEETTTSNGKPAWHVAYRVTMCLAIGRSATYTEVAIGAATLPDRGQAHDMAVKTAESDALKRCAINLGTQFGLSLYQNGSTTDVVKWTLDGEAPVEATETPDEPVAPEASPAPENATAPAEPVAEATSADPNVGTDLDTVMADLRSVYGMESAAVKIQRVAEIKGSLTPDTLDTVVTIQGMDMTIERLCDKVASDALAAMTA